jgi:AcrR family transcriptional regulator
MPAERTRTRRDPRREATRVALIEKAEALIAEFGVLGVSTRQIGAAIGSANNNVVAYHFGSKEELITAIYHHRLPAIEARRAELLAELELRGHDDNVFDLMVAIWRPLYEQRGEDGKPSYVAFLAGLARSGWAWTRYSLGQDYPVTNAIIERLRPTDRDGGDDQQFARLDGRACTRGKGSRSHVPRASGYGNCSAMRSGQGGLTWTPLQTSASPSPSMFPHL